MNITPWISLMTFVAWLATPGLGQDSTASVLVDQKPPREELRRVTVTLSTLDLMQTLVGGSKTGQPPWPAGNCLSLSPKPDADSELPSREGGPFHRWHVSNMHAENFRELVKRERIESLELGLVGDRECFVVDARVPQEWLRIRPCPTCYSLERRLFLRTNFADLFQKEPQVESLVGTTWVLESRTDPDGLLGRMLPGNTIRIQENEIICRAASGEVQGRRLWEGRSVNASMPHPGYPVLSSSDNTGAFVEVIRDKEKLEMRGLRGWSDLGPSTPVSLSVYDVLSTRDYTGAVLETARDKDRMVVVATGILSRSRSKQTVGWERYRRGTAIAIYRLER